MELPDPDDDVGVGKLLSLVLRHRPEAFGLSLDAHGWLEVEGLLGALRHRGLDLSPGRLAEIVARSDKRRFALDETGRRIRAQQGHSVDVDLAHAPARPPDRLLHGTVARFLASIREHGLRRGQRHHVHLTDDLAVARAVAARRGSPVVLEVDAARMLEDGLVFFVTPNAVWLTEHVPPEYLRERDP